MFDYLLKNGSVVDGTGRGAIPADVGIEGGRITAVGQIGDAESAETIDASGLVISPGFIDIHAHSDLALLEDPLHSPKVMQGVTTDAFSSCGLGFAPLTPETLPAVRSMYGPIFGSTKNIGWGWKSIGDYMDHLDGRTSVNCAYHAAHGPIRLAVMGAENREPTQTELERMAGLVGEAMDRGAIGMSTGLAYAPMTYSGHNELVALTREVAKRNGLFSIHMRSYADKIAEAVEEALTVCAESGARLQISHYMVNGTANRGRAGELLGWIEKGRERGVDVSFDAYPYTAGSTVVQMCLPEWAQAGGPEKLLERLRNEEIRARVIADLRQSKSIEWDKSVIAGVKTSNNARYVGMNFPSAAELAGMDLHEFICRLLSEEDLEVSHVVHMGSEPDMRIIMQHPAHSFGSDGLHFEGRPHPRLYGCFPRVLGRYVRQDNVLTLPQAIHKMTGHNAARLGFRDRGVIGEGKAADVVVFDPVRVMDRATYEDPRQYPEGIRLVMVNGRAVVRDGQHLGATPGRVTGRLA